MEWVFLAIGFVVGAASAWFFGRTQSREAMTILKKEIEDKNTEIHNVRGQYDQESRAHSELRARLVETERRLEEQRAFVEESKKALADAFSTLSREALKVNREEFLGQANTDLENRHKAIENLLKPLDKALREYQDRSQKLESSLKEDYGTLRQRLEDVMVSTRTLSEETTGLKQALRRSEVRGKWGEMALRNAAEVAGMSQHCDFIEQDSVRTESGIQRPDMLVHLPGERVVVVDSKVPLVAFLDAIEASNEDERRQHLERHANQVKTHMRQLATKAYWNQFEAAPDFVVMFVPGESFFSAAVDTDRTLLEEGMRSKVILASPTTFVALLRAVEMGWRQERFAQNAVEIRNLGAEIHERILTFVEHFANVGKSLDRATAAYNSAVGSLDSRVLVTARKFKELGATSQEEIPEVQQIDRAPRALQAELLPIGEDNPDQPDD